MNYELIETLLQAAQDAREAFPEMTELDDVGSRRLSTREFYGLADHLLCKRHFSKIVPAAAAASWIERLEAGDEASSLFWLRLLRAMFDILQTEPEPGELLH